MQIFRDDACCGQRHHIGAEGMKIFVQNVRSKEFYAGEKRWSTDPILARPFNDVFEAVQFCQAASREDPEMQLIIHFRKPTTMGVALPQKEIKT